jgi:hypothetical protein
MKTKLRSHTIAIKSPHLVYLYLYTHQIKHWGLDQTNQARFSASSFLAFSFAAFSRLPSSASIPMPPNTHATPTHCMPPRLCPNQTTEMIMVSIFLVTVTVTRKSEPKMDNV